MSIPPLPRPESKETIDNGDLRDLVLYRVGLFTQAWFDAETEEKFGQTVSLQRLGRTIEKMARQGRELNQGLCVLTIQELSDDFS